MLASPEDAKSNRELALEHGLTCPILLMPDDGSLARETFKDQGTPVAYLLDEQGKVAQPVAVGGDEIRALARGSSANEPRGSGSPASALCPKAASSGTASRRVPTPWGVEKSSFSAVIGLAELEKSVALSPEMEGALFHGWSRTWQPARRQARRNQHRIAAPGGYSRGCSRRAGIAGRRSPRGCRSGSKPCARSCRICRSRDRWRAKADALKRQVDELRAEMQRRAEQSPPPPALSRRLQPVLSQLSS